MRPTAILLLTLGFCPVVLAQDLPPGLQVMIKKGLLTLEEAQTLYPGNLTPVEIKQINEQYAPVAPVVPVVAPTVPQQPTQIAPLIFKPAPLPKMKKIPPSAKPDLKLVPALLVLPPAPKAKT